MDKEQLKKILKPVKRECLSHRRCSDNCPLNSRYGCSIKRQLTGVDVNPENNSGKPYIEMLDKCIHEFCGKESCSFCPESCTFKGLPPDWNLDELP